MEITNLSGKSLGILYSWLPRNLKAEKIVFLPDACPGKSPLPTGTVVLTKQVDWRQFALSDVGCGMRLLESTLSINELTQKTWDEVAILIKQNKGGLGDLGGGNHFLDALLPYDSNNIHFLIHTGSRKESGLLDSYIDKPALFDSEYSRIVNWAKANREKVQETLQSITGSLKLVLDTPHNSFEETADGILIRKGAVKVHPGEIAVIPSHVSGDVALVEATRRIEETLFSMSVSIAMRQFHFAFSELPPLSFLHPHYWNIIQMLSLYHLVS